MKLGFNEANDRFCANHSVMMDLELCEKYGFDCIDIQSECLNRDLEAGKITLEEMGAWFQSHHLKMLSYNALCFFNMKQTQEEKDAGVSAILMGCVGITEGAIPYAANDPIRVIPSLMVGSAVGSALAYAMNVENRAAWGGLITAPTSSPWYLYILCILVGSAVTALMVTLLKKPVKELEADSADDADLDIKFE